MYAVEFSHRSGRDLVNMAKKRTNVIPIIEDARHPAKYRMLVGMVDVIFSDVAQPDQVCFVLIKGFEIIRFLLIYMHFHSIITWLILVFPNCQSSLFSLTFSSLFFKYFTNV